MSGMAQFKPKSLALTLQNHWHYLKRNSQCSLRRQVRTKQPTQKMYQIPRTYQKGFLLKQIKVTNQRITGRFQKSESLKSHSKKSKKEPTLHSLGEKIQQDNWQNTIQGRTHFWWNYKMVFRRNSKISSIEKMHTQNLMEALCYNLYRSPGIIMSSCKN